MYNWKKQIVTWKIGKTLYLSVVFTWQLPEAKKIAELHKGPVIAGGPAVSLMPDYLRDVGDCQTETIFPVLSMHNPMATFTTRGCPAQCSFCAVPQTEGEFRELESWTPTPLVCDNNLLESSRRHFDRVMYSLRPMPFVDFNQGLDPSLLRPHHLDRMSELTRVKIRFSFDSINDEAVVMDAIAQAQSRGLDDIGVYVLIGYNDSPEDAQYRLEMVRSTGAMPNPMRYQPLYSLRKNEYVGDGWTGQELSKMTRYYSRLIHLGRIPYDEFKSVEDGQQCKLDF